MGEEDEPAVWQPDPLRIALAPSGSTESQPWFDLATRFVDEWDMQSFDPDYENHLLEHFEPLVRRLVKDL